MADRYPVLNLISAPSHSSLGKRQLGQAMGGLNVTIISPNEGDSVDASRAYWLFGPKKFSVIIRVTNNTPYHIVTIHADAFASFGRATIQEAALGMDHPSGETRDYEAPMELEDKTYKYTILPIRVEVVAMAYIDTEGWSKEALMSREAWASREAKTSINLVLNV